MSRKEAISARGGRWNAILAWAGGLLALAGVIWAAQHSMRPTDANAQAPIRRPNSPRTGTPRTAPQTSAPRTRAPLRTPAPAANRPGLAGGNGPALAYVAEVNNERISRQELGAECLKRFGNEVLESIVNREVIFQACRRRNITITDADVDAEINTIAKRFGMDVDTWLKLLRQEREISTQKYRRELIWPTLALRKLAQAQLVVSQDDIQKALESEYGPKVRGRIISVSTKKKADELLEKARANPDSFGDLAKQFSEDPNSASARGLIPPIRKHIGDPKVEAAAFALQEGEISDVIFVAEQYILIKCDKLVPQEFLTPDQIASAKERATAQIRDQRLRSEAARIFKTLQDEAQVVTILGDKTQEQRHPGVAALINGSPISIDQLAEECILRHGEDTLEITISRRLLTQALKRAGKSVTRADVDSEIQRAADAFGYLRKDGSPDVQKWLETVTDNDPSKVDIYVGDAVRPSAALKKLVTERITVNEEDLKKGYDANFGERVEALAIMMNNGREAQKVWNMARNNPTDEFFGELASQYSIEPVSKANFGRVPPIRRHSGQKNLEDEAFRLKPGDLSELIAVGSNYIILRCLGRTKPMVRLDEVREELQKDLHEKKLRLAMNTTFERLKEQARIKNLLAPKKSSTARTVLPASGTAPVRRSPATSANRAPTRAPVNGANRVPGRAPAPRTRR